MKRVCSYWCLPPLVDFLVVVSRKRDFYIKYLVLEAVESI